MKYKPETICIVCYANFCRSPVAEKILKNKMSDRYNLISAGLNPFYGKGMDARSKRFLIERGIKDISHMPKKLTKEIVEKSKIIFAMDTEILLEINKMYPGSKDKVKLISQHDPKIKIYDPFRMNEEDYNLIMSKIEALIDTMTMN